MTKTTVICVRSLCITDIENLVSELKIQLSRTLNLILVMMTDDVGCTSIEQICEEHPEAELILIGTSRSFDCPTIYIAGEDAFIPCEGREYMIAIAANGDLRHSELKISGYDPDILDRDDVEGIAAYIAERSTGMQKKSSFRCKSKLVLTGDCDFFGPGIARLLHRIDEMGSIRKAANNMEMSYSKAWKMIGKAEDATGIQFLERINGGKAGGNSVLTDNGRMFLDTYDKMSAELNHFSDQLFDRYMREFLK